jgi:hypothetical protein
MAKATPIFRVFDWARAPDFWQTDIPLAGLGNYLATRSAHGRFYQVLPVWNSTWRISTTSYRNQALLYNRVRGGWDLIYQYDYAATDTQQKTPFTGSWAAIVETFQSLYSGTFGMGALQIQLISANNSGTWGAWLLRPADSYIRSDNVGFQLVVGDSQPRRRAPSHAASRRPQDFESHDVTGTWRDRLSRLGRRLPSG